MDSIKIRKPHVKKVEQAWCKPQIPLLNMKEAQTIVKAREQVPRRITDLANPIFKGGIQTQKDWFEHFNIADMDKDYKHKRCSNGVDTKGFFWNRIPKASKVINNERKCNQSKNDIVGGLTGKETENRFKQSDLAIRGKKHQAGGKSSNASQVGFGSSLIKTNDNVSQISLENEFGPRKKVSKSERRNGFKMNDDCDKHQKQVEELDEWQKGGERVVGSSGMRSCKVSRPHSRTEGRLVIQNPSTFKLPHSEYAINLDWEHQEISQTHFLDEWEMVNISGIEFTRIKCPSFEGKTFPSLAQLVIKEAGGNPVNMKVIGNQIVFAFFSFESLSKEEEYVRQFEEKKPDFDGAKATVVMVSLDSVEELAAFKTHQGYSVLMASDGDKKLMNMLETTNEKGRQLRHVMVLDKTYTCVKHIKDLTNKDDAAMPLVDWLKANTNIPTKKK